MKTNKFLLAYANGINITTHDHRKVFKIHKSGGYIAGLIEGERFLSYFFGGGNFAGHSICLASQDYLIAEETNGAR